MRDDRLTLAYSVASIEEFEEGLQAFKLPQDLLRCSHISTTEGGEGRSAFDPGTDHHRMSPPE